jgi:hypothetical protein
VYLLVFENEAIAICWNVSVSETLSSIRVNTILSLSNGSRQDLIEKCMNDVKGFDRDQATKEVDKFLMDAEMVNILIAFNKRYPNGIEDGLSPANILGTYINWFAAAVGLLYIKNTFVMPKVESGEWTLPFGLFAKSSGSDFVENAGVGDVVASVVNDNAGAIEIVAGAVNDSTI